MPDPAPPPDDIAQALDTARRVADLTEQTLAPLLLALTGWRPEFRAIVLGAVGRRALALADEAERDAALQGSANRALRT